MTNLLITGGAGFIGSNSIRFFLNKYSNYNIVNIDKLTYAGKNENILDFEKYDNYYFEKCDICNYDKVLKIFKKYNINKVIHFAAESHVDNSIENPFLFAETNIIGTLTLLKVCLKEWENNFDNKLFYHISTDEVYGSLGKNGLFTEETPYDPRSPYSSSKASSDHFVRSYFHTYKLPYLISNCSNNFGPYQHSEKLIPLVIKNIFLKNPIPIYGNGENIRDWLYVQDHIDAIDLILHSGKINTTYNIGGSNEWKNIDLINLIIEISDKYLKREKGFSNKLKSFVKDRKGHDFRYAIDSKKIHLDLNWKPKFSFKESLSNTVKWYIDRLNLSQK